METDTPLGIKRWRTCEVKRWSIRDKDLLLQIAQEDPIKLEKPTAQIFYNKLMRKYPQFAIYGWRALRDKMRNLRLKYTKALEWRERAIIEEDSEEAERAVREHMLKMCEDFYALDFIYKAREKEKSKIISKAATAPSDEEAEPEDNGTCVLIDSPEVHFLEIPADSTSINQMTKDSNNSATSLSRIDKNTKKYLKEKLQFQMNVEERKLLMEEEKYKFLQRIEERKLKLEEEKAAIERLKFQEDLKLRQVESERNYNLNKMRLEKEMALQELELKYKYNKE